MTGTVVWLIDTEEQANEAVRELIEDGLAPAHIGVLARRTVLGGAFTRLVGFGGLEIPEMGSVMTAGTLTTALDATARVGARLGALTGTLTGLGVPPSDIARCAECVRRWGVLVATTADDEEQARATHDILDRRGGRSVEGRIASSAGRTVPAG